MTLDVRCGRIVVDSVEYLRRDPETAESQKILKHRTHSTGTSSAGYFAVHGKYDMASEPDAGV